MGANDAHFGFDAVSPQEKTRRVKGVFDSVAERYDVMNDLLSAGLHRLWKRFAVGLLDPRPGNVVVDLAGGTGDLARMVAGWTDGAARVILCDINERMVGRGRDRSIDVGVAGGIEYVQGDAQALPFANAVIDRIVIGFGLRNVTHKSRALLEMHRVLRPGGKVVVLEFSEVKSRFLAGLYDAYSFKGLPLLGRVVAGDADSYRYLAESIRMHPGQEALKIMMQRAGFEAVRYNNICTGLVAVHSARRF